MLVLITYDVNTEDAAGRRRLRQIAKPVSYTHLEAQMLPLPYLRPCAHAVSQLVEHYHASAVLCTACLLYTSRCV